MSQNLVNWKGKHHKSKSCELAKKNSMGQYLMNWQGKQHESKSGKCNVHKLLFGH